MTDDGWTHAATQKPYRNSFWVLDTGADLFEVEERGPDGSVVDHHRTARVDLPQWLTFVAGSPAHEITNDGRDLLADVRGDQE